MNLQKKLEKLKCDKNRRICKTVFLRSIMSSLKYKIHLTKKDILPIIAVFNCTLAYTTEARNSKNQVSLFANDDFFSTMKQSPWILVPSAKSFKSFETVIFVVCI